MAHKKKNRPRPIECLTRKPQNSLDARVLSMKQRARTQALETNGAVHLEQGPIPTEEDVHDDADEKSSNVDMDLDDRPHVSPPYPTMDPPVPTLDNDLAQNLNRGFYSGRRAHEEVHWRTRHPAMFQAFLQMQHVTQDWSHPQTFDHDLKKECSCQGPSRTVDVLDLTCEYSGSHHSYSGLGRGTLTLMIWLLKIGNR